MSHTPGPWSSSQVGYTNDGNAIIVTGEPGSDDRKPVAHALCQSKYKRGEGWKAKCTERDENANIIAAAPDMLAALENLENDDGSIPDHAWRIVQDAIAKAKGVL